MVLAPGWYPRADQYWFDPAGDRLYPRRYGDVFEAPDLPQVKTARGALWRAVIELHPSCELGAKARDDSQALVARVRSVAEIEPAQRVALRAGFAERTGDVRPAYVHTFWLAPLPDTGDEDLFCDFRAVTRVPTASLFHRLGALSHDARLALIRREILFKYRWQVPLEIVRRNEIARIEADPNFEGPRPDWAGEYRP